jgi:translin
VEIERGSMEDFEGLHQDLRAKDRAREASIKTLRLLIRVCGDGIRSLHRGEAEAAREARERARQLVDQLKEDLKEHADLYHSGSVNAGLAEYTELIVVLGLLVEKKLCGSDEIGVPPVAYLNGLGDAIGEVRRHILNLLRRGEVEEAEEYLRIAEGMYEGLMTFDYPRALVGDLRRRQDVARSLLEKTRADVTSAVLQKNLADKLESLGGHG